MQCGTFAQPIREVRTDLGLQMQPDEKIQWMRDARIGMFIHWGLYAGPARGEWVMHKDSMSVTRAWGYTSDAEDPSRVRSLSDIKRICSDCMVRDMCFLINVGPDRHGHIADAVQQRLRNFGRWTKANAPAIYGTRGGPWQPVDGQYGFTYKDNCLYIYFLGGYTETSFTLPPFEKGLKARNATLLATGERVKLSQKGQTATLKGLNLPKEDVTIVCVELNKNL